MDAIADRKNELEDVEYIACLALRPYKIFQSEYREAFPLVSAFLQQRRAERDGQVGMGQLFAQQRGQFL